MTRIFTEAGLAAKLELQPDPLVRPAARRPRPGNGRRDDARRLPGVPGAHGRRRGHRPAERQRPRAGDRRARSCRRPSSSTPPTSPTRPPGSQELPRGNIVTVRYTGDQSEHVTVTDANSVAIYGERAETIDTTIVSLADATYRANLRLSRSAYSHWNIPEAPAVRGLELDARRARSCSPGCPTARRPSRGRRCSRAGRTRSPATHGG